MQSGVKRQFHIKALNSVAKEQAKAKNTGASSAANPAIPKQSVRAAKQQAFVAQLSAMQVLTPKKDPPKRKETQNKTGLTQIQKRLEMRLFNTSHMLLAMGALVKTAEQADAHPFR